MSSIATKNGAVLLSGASVATGCGCCVSCTNCVCREGVTVEVSASNFVRHLLLRSPTGNYIKWSLAYIAAPASGTFQLQRGALNRPTSAYNQFVSSSVQSPGSGRLTAVFYGLNGKTMSIGIPITIFQVVRSNAVVQAELFQFLSLEEIIAANSFGPPGGFYGSGTLPITFDCNRLATGNGRYESTADGEGWLTPGTTVPCDVCDFRTCAGVYPVDQGQFWFEGRRLITGTPHLLRPEFELTIESDEQIGNPVVRLAAVNTQCSQQTQEGACCEGATCSIKPQCQCQGTGKVFKGVGTTCSPNPCGCGYGKCCGPGQFVNVLGQTRYTCQQLSTKSACDQIGGEWTECGICQECGDEKNPGPCGCDSFNPLP